MFKNNLINLNALGKFIYIYITISLYVNCKLLIIFIIKFSYTFITKLKTILTLLI